jgi:putative phosphoribosyl transferase
MAEPGIFTDRREAGRLLAARLLRFRDAAPLVLALPRGGVPVGFEIARALAAPLDIVLVRKIGAPGQPELGIGAVVDCNPPAAVMSPAMLRLVAPPAGYVEAETARQVEEIARRRTRYGRTAHPAEWGGHTLIVVDDGIATGATARAVLHGLRQVHARALVLAVPVAAADSLEELASDADEIVCLSAPRRFSSVGEHYADFRQTEDDEVIALLAEAAQGWTRSA